MPEGAISEDLESKSRFEKYAKANVERWYRYINGHLGREAENGDIHLVVGCDKTTSWGMASLSNMARNSRVKFKPLDPQSSSSRYTWEYSGVANAKAGPDQKEIDELKGKLEREGLDGSATPDKYLNQCLFVRTQNLTLNQDVWEILNREIRIGCTTNAEHGTGTPSHSSGNRSTPSDSTQFTSSTTPGNIGNQGMAGHSSATEFISPTASANCFSTSMPPTTTVSRGFQTGAIYFKLTLFSRGIPPVFSMKLY